MKKNAKKNKTTIKNKKRFCIIIFTIIAVIFLIVLLTKGVLENKYEDAGSVKE